MILCLYYLSKILELWANFSEIENLNWRLFSFSSIYKYSETLRRKSLLSSSSKTPASKFHLLLFCAAIFYYSLFIRWRKEKEREEGDVKVVIKALSSDGFN